MSLTVTTTTGAIKFPDTAEFDVNAGYLAVAHKGKELGLFAAGSWEFVARMKDNEHEH